MVMLDSILIKEMEYATSKYSKRHQNNDNPFLTTMEAEKKTPVTSSAAFLEEFNTDVSRVRSQIEASSSADAVDAICPDLDRLHERLAQAVFLLPAYDLRRAHERLDDMTAARQQKSEILRPRVPFRFRNHGALAKRITSKEVNFESEQMNANKTSAIPTRPSSTSHTGTLATRNLMPRSVEPVYPKNSLEITDTITAQDPVTFESDTFRYRDVSISRLKSRTIHLCNVTKAVRISSLVECVLYIGPVSGSVRVDGCSGSRFYVAAHQVRIHQSNNCVFSLQTSSSPIIESSTDLKFAPYSLQYPNIEQHKLEAGIENTDCWKDVQDFSWLQQGLSPNWSICTAPSVVLS